MHQVQTPSPDTRLRASANAVTLVRAVLSLVVALMVATSFVQPVPVPLLVGTSTVALALDWVDGQVARRTGTVSEFGARFDMEVDAFLILVLSVYVARDFGAWVLLIGLARYLLLAAEQVWPWLRRPVPPRYWRKAVAAIQGIVLTVAASALPPHVLVAGALVVALLLLAESFGRDVAWLAERPFSAVTSALATWLAVLLLWGALTLPDRLAAVHVSTFARLPVELVVLVAVGVLLPRRLGTVVLVVAGVVLGLLTILKILDIAFWEALRRPFDVVVDWRYGGSTVGLVHDSFGNVLGTAILAVFGVVILGLLTLVPLALLTLRRRAVEHRRRTLQGAAALLVVWSLLAVAGTGLATAGTSSYAEGQVARVPALLHDEHEFLVATRDDPMRNVPADKLLRGLRGKDVLLVFVESYGRSAVQGSSFSPGVGAALADGNRQLTAAGFGSRSAFLTSPTFGALSWLAHSTLQSGLWVDGQQRYDALVTSHRLTLATLFSRAGWRTVSDVPADTHDWPQGAFYGYDHFYDSRNVGYAGPRFGYPTMPDQFTLDALGRHELSSRPRLPVFAEVDLISSHAPWSRTPRMVTDAAVGDGSVYDGMPATLPSEGQIWPSPTKVQAAYGKSIQYSIQALVSFVVHHASRNTVLVVLGDHQPATIVSGNGADHDVPVSVIAKDPSVLSRIGGWGWQDGLHPSPEAPVWRMDTFRDRFLAAYAH